MASHRTTYFFGSFALSPEDRSLHRDGHPVKLGSRAFDLLWVLVQNRNRVVPKAELLDAVWPDAEVEEANLPVQVLALRQVLGREAIATVPGRGYGFVWPVAGGEPLAEHARHMPGLAKRANWLTNLPSALEPLIGRDRERTVLSCMVAEQRLVTLLGSAGVGKSRLSRAVAFDLGERYADGVWWIELAPLTDARRVPHAVAQVLHLTLNSGEDAAVAVATLLRDSQSLLVLDNAEHVLAGVRELVMALGQRAPQVHVLVTSQAALHVPNEQRQPLAPMSVPDEPSLASCRRSDAVTLFEARARAAYPTFTLDGSTAAAVADVCCRLDGIPLAIELAAARLPLLGLEGLRHRLDERFQLLTAGSAVAMPRHQTLRAAMSWSFDLLSPQAQRVFRRLGVFAGGCTLEAAQQVAGDPELGPWDVVEHLANLVDRSLVQAEGGVTPRYRLLETARLFALEQLGAAEELEQLRERHARALDALLTVRKEDNRLWRTPPTSSVVLVAELENARAAMRWARTFADADLALSLAVGTSYAFLTADLNAEYLEEALPLRDRVRADTPPSLAGRFWSRIAFAAGRNGHAVGLEAGRNAIGIWRQLGEHGWLYDALTWTIAIGARNGQVAETAPLIDEGELIEQADWPPALRSSFCWAKHRWWQLQGRPAEALACARAQAELLAQTGSWVMHVAWGANVADCELSLGRPVEAEAHARTALQALDALGVDQNIVGHVMDALVVALVELDRGDEALPVARRARRLLAREGDDLRLLEPLAAAAGARGNWEVAAQLIGHADAGVSMRGEKRWPSAVQRRNQLQRRLEHAVPAAKLRELMRAGAAMGRDKAFELGFDDGPTERVGISQPSKSF